MCKEKGVGLIHIFEDEYFGKKDIVLNKIQHILGVDGNKKKVYGRKCEVQRVDGETAKMFMEKYHIQGGDSSTVHYGAFYDDNLIAVMSFLRNKGDEWELTRFASDYHYICCGVGGKLFKKFIKEHNPKTVKSFADRRWTLNSEDNLYISLGFKLTKILKPEYRYINNSQPKERIHKFNLRKKSLHRKYNLSMNMTEKEMTKELGYAKIWDCGLYKYEWKKQP